MKDKTVRWGLVMVAIAAVVMVLFPLALMAQDSTSTLNYHTPLVENDILPDSLPVSALPVEPISHDAFALVDHALSITSPLAIAPETSDGKTQQMTPTDSTRRVSGAGRSAGTALAKVRPVRRLRGNRVYCGPGGCS
jgi:hypothetical protein